MTPRPQRRSPSAVSPIAQEPPRLVPGSGQLAVGSESPQVPAPQGTAPRTRPERKPFGSYLDPDLHHQFKVACLANRVEMQDALAEAIAEWVAKRTPSQGR